MFWRRRQLHENDLESELRSHLELETEEQQKSGLPADDARYAAQRAFGNTTFVKEEVREMWGSAILDTLVQDTRYAARVLGKSPGFTLVAVLSLGLGIGANTAIFTFVNAAMLKPLPYANSERIVALSEISPKGGGATLVHPRSFLEWHERSHSFEALAIGQTIPVNPDGRDGPEQVSGMWVTPELVQVFGIAPILGRTFSAAEGQPGSTPSVVLAYGYWRDDSRRTRTSQERRFASNEKWAR